MIWTRTLQTARNEAQSDEDISDVELDRKHYTARRFIVAKQREEWCYALQVKLSESSKIIVLMLKTVELAASTAEVLTSSPIEDFARRTWTRSTSRALDTRSSNLSYLITTCGLSQIRWNQSFQKRAVLIIQGHTWYLSTQLVLL
jgi:hypothetical protein